MVRNVVPLFLSMLSINPSESVLTELFKTGRAIKHLRTFLYYCIQKIVEGAHSLLYWRMRIFLVCFQLNTAVGGPVGSRTHIRILLKKLAEVRQIVIADPLPYIGNGNGFLDQQL